MGPLKGLKVIEMAGLAAAPYCAMLLADAGAGVLRIDRVGALAGKTNPYHDVLNRNRSSIEVDVKTADGRQTVIDLVNGADVLLEGFRPGVMERLGLGPDTFKSSNAKLIYGRLTGWGQDGPLSQAAGHDVNYIALSGALNHIGPAGAPPVIPLNLLGDFAGGGMLLAFGVMCAVFEARQSGLGQVVDAAMVDGSASLMSFLFGHRAEGILGPGRGGSVLNGASPFYNVYETADHAYISLAAAEPQFYAMFLQLTGQDPSKQADQYNEATWPETRRTFEALFKTKTRAQWCEILEGTDACFAPVLTLDEVAEHPHNRLRSTFVTVEGVLQPSPAPRFSRTPSAAPSFPDIQIAESVPIPFGKSPDPKADGGEALEPTS